MRLFVLAFFLTLAPPSCFVPAFAATKALAFWILLGRENQQPETESEKEKMGPRGVGERVLSFQFSVSGAANGVPGSGFQFPVCGKEQPTSARQISRQLTRNWPQIKDEMAFLSRYLTKWNLVKAIGILSEARKGRFLRSKKPKYGSMNKGFTEEELERFFRVIDCPKMRLLFSFQAILGLRIGEAIRVNIKDINLRTRELRIFSEKSSKTDYLLMPEKLFDAALSYTGNYEKEIAASQGFLFFSLEPCRRTGKTSPHLTSQTVRMLFRTYIQRARLEEIYGYSAGPQPKPLFRLSPHSLRYYAITNFCRKNGGNAVLSSRFARHTNLQTTMTYIHTGKEELYESIEKAHNTKLLEMVMKLQETL